MRAPRSVAFGVRGVRLVGGRVGRLVFRREVQLVGALWLVTAVAECFSWSTGRPTYWTALLANGLVGPLGIVIGIAAVRVEQALAARRGAGEAAVPPAARGPVRAVLTPIVSGWVLLGSLVLLDLVVLGIHGRSWGAQATRYGVVWFILLPFASVPFSVTVGVALGLASRSRVVIAALGAVLLLGSAIVAAWPYFMGPQLGMFDHLLGYYATDHFLTPDAMQPLFWFAVLGLCWVGLAVGLLALGLDEVDLRVRAVQRAPRPVRHLLAAIVLTGAAFAAVVSIEMHRSDLDFHYTKASAIARYGHTVRTEHFVIHYATGYRTDPAWVRRTVEAHEFAYEQVIQRMHLPDGTGAPITSFVTGRCPEGLLGVPGTLAAKPWRHAIFLSGRLGQAPAFIERELAYVLAGQFGRGPLRVTTRGGVLPDDGFERGFAIAASWPWWSRRTVHQAARLLRANGKMPRAEDLLGGTMGIEDDVLEPGPRATCAASFITWLVDTRGVEVVERAFHDGDIREIGDLETLYRAWNGFLDTVPVRRSDWRVVYDGLHWWNHGLFYLSQKGPDEETCSHLDPGAVTEAKAAHRCAKLTFVSRYRGVAEAWMRRTVALEPRVPPAMAARLDAALAAHDLHAAWATLERLVDDPAVDPVRAAERLALEGNMAWRAGRLDEAARDYRAELDLDVNTEDDDHTVRLLAVEDPILAPYLRYQLLPNFGHCWGLRLHSCRRMLRNLRWAIEVEPQSALAHYLRGELLSELDGHQRERLDELELANKLGLAKTGGLAEWNLRNIARLRWRLGNPTGAIAAWTEIENDPAATTDLRLEASRFAARYRFYTAYRARHHWPPPPDATMP